MTITNQLKNQHLLWRAGFGPMAEELAQLRTASQPSYVKALFSASSKSPTYLDVADNAIKGLAMGIDDIVKQNRQLTQEEKKQLRKQSREDLKSLNLAWLGEMVNSDQQLREKLSLFWHGHFASRNINILYQQQLLHSIRKNALGNFGDLLREVSKSAAMINFLNNNQNRKDHPNENFAREVMELFTLGRGHYTEDDIKEAARAFTGWGANLGGDFVFRPFQHDTGRKTVLGKTGNFDGDDILNILLEQKQTARFITHKVYRYFVNEVIDEEKVNLLADRFYQSNYNIAALMRDIFASDWFYNEKNIGTRIKSPVELLVGMQRVLPMKFDHPEVQLLLQRLLGQLLFFPPNVAGWPGGKNWIDSSSLMLRLRVPQLLASNGELSMQPKTDDDQAMGRKENASNRNGKLGGGILNTSIDWKSFSSRFNGVVGGGLVAEIAGCLLQSGDSINKNILNSYINRQNRDTIIQSATINLMSTPEYQLC